MRSVGRRTPVAKEYTPMNWDDPNLLMMGIGAEVPENIIGIFPIGNKERGDDKVWMALGVQSVPDHLRGKIKRGDSIPREMGAEFDNQSTTALLFKDTQALDTYISLALRLRAYMAEKEEDAAPSILDLLVKVRDACLYADDGYTGVTDQPCIDIKLFDQICVAINKVHPPRTDPIHPEESTLPICTDCDLPDPVCACEDAAAYDTLSEGDRHD